MGRQADSRPVGFVPCGHQGFCHCYCGFLVPLHVIAFRGMQPGIIVLSDVGFGRATSVK